MDGQTVNLKPGDSWLVPAGARHAYRIIEEFTVVEATSPLPNCRLMLDLPELRLKEGG